MNSVPLKAAHKSQSPSTEVAASACLRRMPALAGLATADHWSKPSHYGVSVAVRSQTPSNSSLRDAIGSSNGFGPLSIPENQVWERV